MTVETPVKTTSEERAERAERMAREGAQAMADHQAAIRAVDERTVRLRAQRLAKQAEEAAAVVQKPATTRRKKAVKA